MPRWEADMVQGEEICCRARLPEPCLLSISKSDPSHVSLRYTSPWEELLVPLLHLATSPPLRQGLSVLEREYQNKRVKIISCLCNFLLTQTNIFCFLTQKTQCMQDSCLKGGYLSDRAVIYLLYW